MNNNIKSTEKQCIKCSKVLPLTKDYFRVARRNKDGFIGTCKVCIGASYTNIKIKKGYKKCSNCKLELKANTTNFGRHKSGGFQSWCKECKRKDHIKNREERNKRNMERYRELNPIEILPEGMKRCATCEEVKPKNEYGKQSKAKDGLRYSCTECRNKEYMSNREHNIKRSRKYYRNNKERMAIITKKYREKNRERYRESHQKYYQENKEAIKENVKRNHYKRMDEDLGYRLLNRCRSRVYSALKAQNTHKAKRTIELIGCTVPELVKHLENQFTEGMTWDNYGKWHVDHIKPCALYDFTKEEHQRECFHYTNLQPLWAEDNFRKSAKYEASL